MQNDHNKAIAIALNSENTISKAHVWAGGDAVGKPMLETLATKEGATVTIGLIFVLRAEVVDLVRGLHTVMLH